MNGTRKFHRAKLSTRIILSQNSILHHGRLENISKSGALIRLEPGTYLQKDGGYVLSVYLEGEEFPLQFSAELVNITFGMAGIKFGTYDSETAIRLGSLLEKLSSEVDIATIEHEKNMRRLVDNFREG